MEKEIAVFIPIIFTLVTGLVFVTYLFFKSREKQMLIEKGLPPEAIKEFYESKKDPFRLLKIGLIIVFFGIGLGLGMMLEDLTGKDYWVPFMLFTVTGLGFVLAGMAGKKLDKKSS